MTNGTSPREAGFGGGTRPHEAERVSEVAGAVLAVAGAAVREVRQVLSTVGAEQGDPQPPVSLAGLLSLAVVGVAPACSVALARRCRRAQNRSNSPPPKPTCKRRPSRRCLRRAPAKPPNVIAPTPPIVSRVAATMTGRKLS